MRTSDIQKDLKQHYKIEFLTKSKNMKEINVNYLNTGIKTCKTVINILYVLMVLCTIVGIVLLFVEFIYGLGFIVCTILGCLLNITIMQMLTTITETALLYKTKLLQDDEFSFIDITPKVTEKVKKEIIMN